MSSTELKIQYQYEQMKKGKLLFSDSEELFLQEVK